jgi:ABC-type sugar transport system ATPase subunit
MTKEQESTLKMKKFFASRGVKSMRVTSEYNFDPDADDEDEVSRPSFASQPAHKSADSESFRPISVPLTVQFIDLSLILKSNGNPVLQDIFGTVKSSEVTALMGPSGAGKTSLLHLLRGQATYASCLGRIYVNGHSVISLSEYKNQMAFVPQDDIMYDGLTVEENVLFSAVLFNVRGYSHRSACIPFVHYVLDLLGIDFIRYSVVGSAEEKGISGGQKKRVSVAMEMMKEAPLFFLDGKFQYYYCIINL